MSDFIRVKSKSTGAEFTLSASAERGDDVEVVDKPAVDDLGRPLPEKPHVDLADLTPQTSDVPPGVIGSEPPTVASKADTKNKE